MQEIDILITGGRTLLLNSTNTAPDRSAIAIKSSDIIDIGPAEELAKKYQAKKTINAENSLVMPGFVNCHTHAAMTCFRGMADDLELID